jgi:hypothetical protein
MKFFPSDPTHTYTHTHTVLRYNTVLYRTAVHRTRLDSTRLILFVQTEQQGDYCCTSRWGKSASG